MLILTTTQANAVRAYSYPGHAIAPRPFRVGPNVFTSGRWGLPDAVLADEFHLALRPALQLASTLADDSIASGTSPANSDWMLASSTTSTDVAACLAASAYSSTWPLYCTVSVSRVGAVAVSTSWRSTST